MTATVVADIGGTSSRWGIIRNGIPHAVIEGLPGFNPVTGRSEGFVRAVGVRFRDEGIHVAEIYAYGAGCGTEARATVMAEALLSIFPKARVEVAGDLMGAARGLLGSRPGMMLILGTGMNAGWYDGTLLHQPMPSLGYILGDEGSGADIGKHLLADAIHGRLPEGLYARIFPEGIDMATVVRDLYQGQAPQAWLAALTGALVGSEGEPYVQRLLEERFHALSGVLTEHFTADQLTGMVGTGSVAFGFREILERVLAHAGIKLTAVQQSPLPGLLTYHSASGR